MTNALTIYKDFDGLQRAAIALQASGYFKDATSQAQAITKVMAGAELGLPPFASMAGIHVINGKPVLGSNVIATLVKNDPRYDYRIKQADEKACVLVWYENGEKVGESSFTIAEAQKITTKENNQVIKLSEKATWRFYTSDMLFARAISRGARRFAPGIFGGSPVYTPDEMGMDTDEEGYIDAPSITVEAPTPEQIDEATEDVGPATLMTVETACAVTTSKGEFYGQLDSETLANMTIGINKGLKRPDLPDDKRDEYLMKLDAIRTILQARESGELAS